MTGRTVSALALLAALIGWATPSLADGALAIGMPNSDPNRGFRWVAQVNHDDPATYVMSKCHEVDNPKIGAACKLIATFQDECVAISVDAGPTDPVKAVGWVIAPDAETAKNGAIAMCDGMRKGRGTPCHLDGTPGFFCDGSAK